MVQSVKPAAAEQMAAKHPRQLDARKVLEELGGEAKAPVPRDKRRERPGGDLGPRERRT